MSSPSLVPLHLTDSASALLAEMEGCAREEELADVLTLLRREESRHLLCGRPHYADYARELIERLERMEHRR